MRIAVAVSSLALLASCASSQLPPDAHPPRPAPATPPAPSPAPGPSVAALLQHVPATARAIMMVSPHALGLYHDWLQARPQMKSELGAYLAGAVGVDLTEIGAIVAYSPTITDGVSVGVFVEVHAPGNLKGHSAGQHRGTQIVSLDDKTCAARVPGGLVVGPLEAVKTAIDVAQGKVAPLASVPGLSERDRRRSFDLLVAVDASALPEPSVQQLVRQFQLRSATLTVDHEQRLVLSVSGDERQLRLAKQMLMGLAALAQKQVKDSRDKAVAGTNVGEAMASIIAFHEFEHVLTEIEPRIAGDRMTSEYRFPKLEGSTMFVAYAGILAAVAIPAFIKYVRKAKTVEATEGLDKLRAGAKAYFEEHRRAGKRFAFPRSTGWTPAASCCGKPGDQCRADADAFAHPTWKALHFQLEDPHRYQYRFTSSGKGPAAHFVIEARGDLDCDGKFSNYRLEGSLEDKELKVVGPVITDELE